MMSDSKPSPEERKEVQPSAFAETSTGATRTGDTLCHVFQRTAARVPDRVALRTLRGARELTWAEYAAHVRQVAGGLAGLGVTHGEPVAIMSSNRIEFHIIDTAIMHLGAVPVSIYNTLPPKDIAYILENSGARTVFAESAFLPALRAVNEHGVALDRVIVIDGAAEDAMALDDLMRGASDFDLDAALRRLRPEDLATISYTSGTTGAPKGVELSHRSILRSIQAIDEVYGSIDGARMVSLLPMAHVAERMFSHWRGIVGGFTVSPVPHPSEVAPYLTDARPEYVFSPPRLFEKLRAAIEVYFESERDPQRRALIAEALRIGADKVDVEQSGRQVDEQLGIRYQELRAEIFVPALELVGLDQVVVALTGSAPVPPDLVRFFLILGLPVYEGWGMSELTAFGAFNRPGDTRIASVGYPLRGAEIRLADDGEILFRSPWLMSGYRGRPDLTAEAVDSDGWLHTGDIGTLVDGRLSIVDRKKELIISAFGKNMSPSNIEFAVKNASPLIAQVCVIGDARPYITALIVIDSAVAATVTDAVAGLHEDPRIAAAVDDAVSAANQTLSRVEQIKRYRIMDAEWLPGGDELSPTMKLKRRQIAEKHRQTIESLYL